VALRSIKTDDQLGMDEKVIADSGVEEALEERQTAKDEAAQYRLAYKNADKRAKSMIERLELPDPDTEDAPSVVRVARFRITKRLVKGRAVSFATEDRVQLSIGLADEEDRSEPDHDDATEEQAAIDRLADTSSFAKPHAVDDTSDDSDAPVKLN
jgi:hypothetical protein